MQLLMCSWAMLDIVANQVQEVWGKQESKGGGWAQKHISRSPLTLLYANHAHAL